MFPKRGAFATLLTVMALLAILAYRTPDLAPPPDMGSLIDSPSTEAPPIALLGPTPTDSPSPSPSVEPMPSYSTSPGASTPATTPSPTRPPVRRAPTPTRTPAPGFTGKIDGGTEWTEFGPTQVRAVFSSGRLTDVIALKTPNADSRSIQLADRAVPILRSEALKAQSAKINTVSGATYTSQSYISSLQSALDKKPR
jgi:uncharacterized protein with FMN-binding domain